MSNNNFMQENEQPTLKLTFKNEVSYTSSSSDVSKHEEKPSIDYMKSLKQLYRENVLKNKF